MRRLVLAAIAVAACHASRADTVPVADSVAGFSGVQGQNGWYYGYRRQPSQAFVQLPYFGANDLPYWGAPVWGLGYNPWISGFAAIEPSGQQSNGLYSSSADSYADWTDRRWVSTVAGPVVIAGQFGCPGNPSLGDDGVVGQIFIDGKQIWAQVSYHQQPAAYSATGVVAIGSDVDFVLNPNYSDISDWTTWTAQLTPVPEPSTARLLMGFGLPMLLTWLYFTIRQRAAVASDRGTT